MSAQNVALPFDDWHSIRVKTADTSLFARYDGTGPAILLLHGCPQHSLMWHKVGPLLSSKYTVIAPDLPGMGQSTLSESGKYTSAAAAEAIVALLDLLHIEKVAVFGYDKGASVGSVLAWSSYAAGALISPDHVERYSAALSKPGYLRSMTEFLNGNIWREIEYFKPLRDDPIRVSLTVLWGEASMVSEEFSQSLWGPTATSVKTVFVPKAGHWLADENPRWLAKFIDQNVASAAVEPSVVDLSYLEDQITMM
ncbi:hypothetical protein TrVFT333_003408 [Trichoderma virens FT-333]|nr:hypothetical protein TrVFT333_003408 [Trichoderma virens FT-333]